MNLVRTVVATGATVMCLALAGGIYSVTATQQLETALTAYQRAGSLRDAVGDAELDFYSYDDQNNMYVLVAATEPTQVALWRLTYQQAAAAGRQLHQDVARGRGLSDSATLRGLFDQVEAAATAYDGFFDRGHQYVLAGRTSAAASEVTVANLKPSNEIMATLTKLADLVDRGAATSMKQLKSAQAEARASGYAIVVSFIVVVGLALVGFVRLVMSPLARLGRQMREIGHSGDLTRRIGWSRRDELGDLAGSFDGVLEEVRVVVSEVAGNADALAASAQLLTSTSTRIAVAAGETSTRADAVSTVAARVSGNLHTVAAGSEEMTASLREIARNAGEAAGIAGTAVAHAHTTNTTIGKLGASSAEIGNVIKVITSIAAQTNLLALNATIEAARAGDTGKGFAVVASEVKDLAQNSAKAAEDIASRVEAIQSDVAAAVAAISQIAAVIDQISGVQATIAGAVDEQTATTGEISRNVTAAATGSDEITDAVVVVAAAAQSTTGGIVESQETATDLARRSAELQQLVSRFTY